MSLSSTIVWLLIIQNIINALEKATDDEKWHVAVERKSFHLTRCSRRYTPGVCSAPVAVVWTFVFQIQNCTERLGCAFATRTNRFSTHRGCMRICSALANLYGELLTAENNNSYITPELAYRRNVESLQEREESSENIVEEDQEGDGLGDPAILSFTEPNYDVRELADVTAADIDHARLDYLPDPADLFHDMFGRKL